jgi:hypothetical protein
MEKASPETQIAVIELTSRPRVISYFGDNRQTAAQKVRALEASFQRGSYTAAFRQADTLLADALGERKCVLVYSDNQENQWTEILKAPPFLRDVEVVLSTTREATAANVAVARPRVQRTFTGNKSVVDFAVELYNQGQVETATVTLRANGREIMRRPVRLADQPAWTMFTAQWEADPRDYLSGEVSITGKPDALAGDNRVFFSLAPMREGRVALLADSPFLRAALSPEVMRGYLATRLLEPNQAAKELRAGEAADVLCVESEYLRSSDVRSLVLHYLNPSPLESNLTYLKSTEDIQPQLVRSSSDKTKPGAISAGVELTRSQILRQHIWWVMLLAGLALLLSESTWLAARKERS